MSVWRIDYIAVEVLNYPLSFVELAGTATGLVSVWLATRASVWTWPTGILNEVFFFALFYQVQLYADMFLQCYFLIVSVYGWMYWRGGRDEQVHVKRLSNRWRVICAVALVAGTVIVGNIMLHLHEWMPGIFALKAAYAFPDAFTTVASILATILLARKQIETWYLWISVDVVSTVLYFLKDIRFVSAEYLIFLCLASYGLYNWKRKLNVA